MDTATSASVPRGLSFGGMSAPFRWAARQNRRSMIGVFFLLPIVILAIAAPVLPIPEPATTNVQEATQSPSLDHPFGTDKLGRDILSRTLGGARISLLIGFSAAGLALAGGVVLGIMAGFMGAIVDRLVMTFVDVMLSFPSLLLVLCIVAVYGNGFTQIVLAIAVADAPRAIRLQRALALGLKSRPYIDAARMASAPTWFILARHIMPNTIAPMIVVASIYAANAILTEASLSFLNLGILPPDPSWGNIISEGRPYLQTAWWISTFPGIFLAIVALSLHLISDGIRQTLDPRLGA